MIRRLIRAVERFLQPSPSEWHNTSREKSRNHSP